MANAAPRQTIAAIHGDTRILRNLVEESIASGSRQVTFEEAGKALGRPVNDPKMRVRLGSVCQWAGRRHEGVLYLSVRDVGFRLAEPKEAADFMASNRKGAVRRIRRVVGRVENLTRGAELGEDEQKRLFVEMAAAGAIMTVGDSHASKLIAARIQSEELPTAEVLKLFQ